MTDADAAAAALIDRARAWSAPLLDGAVLETGEGALTHADGACAILVAIGADAPTRACAYLTQAASQLAKPDEQIGKLFGPELAALAMQNRRLVDLFRVARHGEHDAAAAAAQRQQELMRRLLLAFSQDLRVVLLRLASRLQSLRYYAAGHGQPDAEFAQESLQVYAPLANRLGLWQLKMQIEDLAFRFAEPEAWARIQAHLGARGAEQESLVRAASAQLQQSLDAHGIAARISGRSKHAYSIWRKMQGKALRFEQLMDLLALRVVVERVDDCYAALSAAHQLWEPLEAEYDDYIARPKPNGYQSLHTVVRGPHDVPLEIQIRTQTMHEHAEQGVAAHWAYKEAGAAGYKGVSAATSYDGKIALARQLLALQRELGGQAAAGDLFADRIYVLTPQARIVELERGSTAVDFAYALHTDLGHRCRGAKVDGALLPLNTPLHSGQTVEIVAAKQGGPSRDWLNPELGFLHSQRARAKARAWFNAQQLEQTQSQGRALVDKLLQREGRSGANLQELASGLGLRSPEQLFERIGTDALSQRQFELYLRGQQGQAQPETLALKASKADGGGVLVVGVGSLLTQLAKCCKPAPPDPIVGFVTRGRGVSVHRADCPNATHLAHQQPQRVIAVAWGDGGSGVYPVDLVVDALDRQGLLRDISEVFAKLKINVIGVQTQSRGDTAHMLFTVELPGLDRLPQALGQLREVAGVRSTARR